MLFDNAHRELALRIIQSLKVDGILPKGQARLEDIEDRGEFKVPFKVLMGGKKYFLALNKLGISYHKQMQHREKHPEMFPEVLHYGTHESVDYSLERFHKITPIGRFSIPENQEKEWAYEIGRVSGRLFRIEDSYLEDRGLVHRDPRNYHITNTKRKSFMIIDLAHCRGGDLHDVVGVFTTNTVGESNLSLTINHPHDFFRGFAETTPITVGRLEDVRAEVPTREQNRDYKVHMR